MIVATLVASSLVSIVVSNITAKMYILERKNRQLESKLDAIDRHVDRIDTRVEEKLMKFKQLNEIGRIKRK